MPADLYMWEEHGGLVHHCPHCQKPLTTPQSRNRCLGDHVEWCNNYHTQLFKKGTSSQCLPCKVAKDECNKRHREIAENIHEIKQLRIDVLPALQSPLTPRTLNTLHQLDHVAGENPLSKRERKVAKKAKKVSTMVKGVVTAADIEYVTKVLRAENAIQNETVDADADMKQNVFFHKGTSNVRHVRNTFLQKDRRGAIESAEYQADPERITGLLQLLNVAPITNATTAEEKAVISVLRKKIEEDLVQLHHEEEGRRMRKAGFWRWANKKAYKRLVANGNFWSNKDGDLLRAIKEEGGRTDSSAATDIETTEADCEVTAPSEEDDGVERPSSSDSNAIATSPGEDKTPKAAADADDGWTTVGKVCSAKVKKPTGKLTLVHNGGLDKLVQSPSAKTGLSSAAGFERWFGTI